MYKENEISLILQMNKNKIFEISLDEIITILKINFNFQRQKFKLKFKMLSRFER